MVADFAEKTCHSTCLNVLLGNSGALRKVPVGLTFSCKTAKKLAVKIDKF